MISLFNTTNPTADGIVNNNVIRKLLSHVFLNSSTFPTASLADKDGKIAVAIPCANIPYGICHTLSAMLNAVTLPALNNDENVLDINTFICTMDDDIIDGMASLNNFLNPSCLKNIFGL
jgi:hypothetical protein